MDKNKEIDIIGIAKRIIKIHHPPSAPHPLLLQFPSRFATNGTDAVLQFELNILVSSLNLFHKEELKYYAGNL